MIEMLASLTAITDPVANVAIIITGVITLKNYIKTLTHGVRLTNLEREVFNR